MLERIITNIVRLRGVKSACIHKSGVTLASSFETSAQVKIDDTMDIFEQIFGGLEAINKSHNEVYFSLDDSYLAVFRLHDDHYAVLLMEKKINFPLIKIGLKSASEKVKQYVNQQQQQQQQIIPEAQNPPSTELIPQTNPEISKVLEQYSAILTMFMGPAARFVVEDCTTEWKKKYIQTPSNLEFLLTLIQNELPSDAEKDRFLQQVHLIVK